MQCFDSNSEPEHKFEMAGVVLKEKYTLNSGLKIIFV